MTKSDAFHQAAIYAYPPCSLKLCGQRDQESSKILFQFLTNNSSKLEPKVINILKKFEAAFPYYQLIAKKNNIDNPLNERVVEAYWIGNELLEHNYQNDLQQLILNDFCQPGLLSTQRAKEKAAEVPADAIPHHSFHVLILGSVTGRVQFSDRLFDLCCVNSGKIIEVNSDSVIIAYSPLLYRQGKFNYGAITKREIDWNKLITPPLKVGQLVTTHWNQVCEIVDQITAKHLQHYTEINITAVNNTKITTS